MVEFEELRLRLLDSEKPIENLKEALAIDSLKAEVEVLEKESAAPDFWDDMENSQKVMQKIGSLKAKVTGYESLKSDYEDALVMIELADEEGDLSLLDDCTASVKDIETRVEDMTLSTLLSGEFDGKNALLTFHAGAGGTEAQDWAEMLFRMYNRWGERHGYKVSTLDYLDGDVAGIKSATILVEGENAYGYLKGEMGIHRLVRVSPFDSSGRRHTSFASVEVMPEIDDDVNVEIREEDIKMDVYRASGAGGQKVNKTSSAVRLTHIPTGIVVSSRLSAASTKTGKWPCVCSSPSWWRSKSGRIWNALRTLRAIKKRLPGAPKFVPMYLCPIPWPRIIVPGSRWAISPL